MIQLLPDLSLSALENLEISGSGGCCLQHKEMEALFDRFNRPSSLKELRIICFSARRSVSPLAKKNYLFPCLNMLQLEGFDICQADLTDLLENLEFTPDLRRLYLRGNPLGHAIRLMVPYLLKHQKLEEVYLRLRNISQEDMDYVQMAVLGKRTELNIKAW